MNESGVQKLLQQKVSLGTDASMAAGPVDPDASGDANAATEVLGYRRAHGSFSGADVSGAVVRADDDADHDVYGVSATPRTILASRALSAPTQATPLLVALRVGGPSATAASAAGTTTPATAGESKPAAPAPPGASGASPTGETDVRAGVVALQQSIDRLIAEANAGESATGAPAAPGTIPVSRERLVQLRRQVDALLATIDRRQ
jgi:hypothetical protein